MKKLLIILCISLSVQLNAQQKELPAEAKPFVLPNYEMLDYITGDLNGDKKQDAILILRTPKEDTITDEDEARPFLILIRQANGKLKLEKRNDNLVMCRQCGGVFGDPYEGTEIKNNGFTVSFYGGSTWRWGYQYRFDYKPAKKDWYLVREKQESFQSGDPETTMKTCIIEETELGEVPIAKYTDQTEGATSHWKVIADKSYFYDNPKLGSKPRKGYLVKGDKADAIRELKNFIFISFGDNKSRYSSGYILKKDLQRIN